MGSYVYLANLTPFPIGISVSSTLSSDYWTQQTTVLDAGLIAGVENPNPFYCGGNSLIEMNRDVGVSSGDYFYFNITISLNQSTDAAAQFVLQARLYGTAVGSDICLGAHGPGFQTGWYTDDDTHGGWPIVYNGTSYSLWLCMQDSDPATTWAGLYYLVCPTDYPAPTSVDSTN